MMTEGNLMGIKADVISRAMRRLKRENSQRRACPICGNLVKPTLKAQHDRAFHRELNDGKINDH